MRTLGLTDVPGTSRPRRPSNASSTCTRSSSSSPTKRQSTSKKAFFDDFDGPLDRPTTPLILPGHFARLLTPQLESAFKTAFSPFARTAETTTIPSSSTTSISPIRLMNDLLDDLTTLELALPPIAQSDQADNRRTLIRCISATRDILHFLAPARFARKPRIGEVSEAIEYVGDQLPVMLGKGGRGDLYGVAEQVRMLSK